MQIAIYIGIRTPGTTSQLRCDALVRALPDAEWSIIDTDLPFRRSARIWRSIAFRLRTGPAVAAINRHVLSQLPNAHADIIWVDKGVCLWPETIRELRKRTERLVYYTPDTSFLHNRSRFFERSIQLYDLIVTTKSLEMPEFRRRAESRKLLLTSQSYDSKLHYPRCSFAEKRRECVLIGLCEPSREHAVLQLLSEGIPVRVGGRGWERFVQRCGNRLPLSYAGAAVFGDAYAEALSKATLGLGMLTHRFPELHTTRTFEIPACGTALATPKTSETSCFFQPNEAVFYENTEELVGKAVDLWSRLDDLRTITNAGHRRIGIGSFDNDSMITAALARIDLKSRTESKKSSG